MAERYKVELGRVIARRRTELGLTQKELAERAHFKEGQTVSRWERGQNLPSDLDVLAEALEWTVAEMVAGIKPPDHKAARKLGLVPALEPGDLMGAFSASDTRPQLDRIEGLLTQIAERLGLQAAREVVDEAEATRRNGEAAPPTRASRSRRRA